jgi:DNA-binding FrmR family transcriptional regulator
MDYTPTTLIHHISRLEGQLASIKKELAQKDPDCRKSAQTLKAASRSFSSLRKTFITCFLNKKYVKKVGDPELIALLSVINS